MISLEQYAELCALMADTAGDTAKEFTIANQHGVTGPLWSEAKTYYTAKMSDPNDMGRTAMAFMPLYQAAQTRARGGGAPCTLEMYTRVHAEMAYRKDPLGNKINYQLVLAEHGFSHQSWLPCDSYWTPRIAVVPGSEAQLDATDAARFRVLMQQESDRIFGIQR
jgi:hypothetical protein